MNKKQKIIISITGIVIVVLVLLGLTYAYFITQIQGNENNKSIEVSTANLKLVYSDNSSDLITNPDPIVPGNFSDTKSFTVTNSGNATIDEYGVILENLLVKYASDGSYQGTSYTQDQATELVYNDNMIMTITCTSSISNKTCNGLDSFLPNKSEILLTNSIEVNEVQSYVVTITYNDSGTDQSVDMNKKIEGKFNIIDTNNTVDLTGNVTNYTAGDYVQINSEKKTSPIYSDGSYKLMGVKPDNHSIKVCHENDIDCTNPTINKPLVIYKENIAGVNGNTITINETSRLAYVNINATGNSISIENTINDFNPFKNATLAYAILNNSFNVTTEQETTNGYAKFRGTPATSPGKVISSNTEADLSITMDNYGKSYYYRGNVKNNYLNFGGMCWRIVRIQGDGSIKIVLADEEHECNNVSYDINGTNGAFIGDGATTTFYYKDSVYLPEYNLNNDKLLIWLNGGTTNSREEYGDPTTITFTKILDDTKLELTKWYDDRTIGYSRDVWTGDSTTICDYDNPWNFCFCDEGFDESLTYEEAMYSVCHYDVSTQDYYSSLTRINIPNQANPTIKYNNGDITSKIGLLTSDEVVFAGAVFEQTNNNYYLYENAKSIYWLNNKSFDDNGSSPNSTNFTASNVIETNGSDVNYYARPAIVLLKNTKLDNGNGTLNSPYTIK